MNGEQFTSEEQALIERLQNAPHAHLRPAAVDGIRRRMLEAFDTPPVPGSAPNWISAHLPIVVGILIAVIVLVAMWIFSGQVSPGLVETATPRSDIIMITETPGPEVTIETTETPTPEVTTEIAETPAPEATEMFAGEDTLADTPNANSVTASAWYDDGTCNNPPPEWAPASGWRRRCGSDSQGTNPGGNNAGQGNNNGNNNSGGNRGQGKGNS